jgi:hypothetical protein
VSRSSTKGSIFDNDRRKLNASMQEHPYSSTSSDPHSHLNAFIERAMGNRPHKRIYFDHSEYEDLKGNLKLQINQKLAERESLKRKEQAADCLIVEKARESLQED